MAVASQQDALAGQGGALPAQEPEKQGKKKKAIAFFNIGTNDQGKYIMFLFYATGKKTTGAKEMQYTKQQVEDGFSNVDFSKWPWVGLVQIEFQGDKHEPATMVNEYIATWTKLSDIERSVNGKYMDAKMWKNTGTQFLKSCCTDEVEAFHDHLKHLDSVVDKMKKVEGGGVQVQQGSGGTDVDAKLTKIQEALDKITADAKVGTGNVQAGGLSKLDEIQTEVKKLGDEFQKIDMEPIRNLNKSIDSICIDSGPVAALNKSIDSICLDSGPVAMLNKSIENLCLDSGPMDTLNKNLIAAGAQGLDEQKLLTEVTKTVDNAVNAFYNNGGVKTSQGVGIATGVQGLDEQKLMQEVTKTVDAAVNAFFNSVGNMKMPTIDEQALADVMQRSLDTALKGAMNSVPTVDQAALSAAVTQTTEKAIEQAFGTDAAKTAVCSLIKQGMGDASTDTAKGVGTQLSTLCMAVDGLNTTVQKAVPLPRSNHDAPAQDRIPSYGDLENKMKSESQWVSSHIIGKEVQGGKGDPNFIYADVAGKTLPQQLLFVKNYVKLESDRVVQKIDCAMTAARNEVLMMLGIEDQNGGNNGCNSMPTPQGGQMQGG